MVKFTYSPKLPYSFLKDKKYSQLYLSLRLLRSLRVARPCRARVLFLGTLASLVYWCRGEDSNLHALSGISS